MAGPVDDPTTPLSHDATSPVAPRYQFEANDVLADRYRIVRIAGAGGMGIVYEAEDLELGERVALKTLHAPQSARQTDEARLRREVQLARRVTHPNVCRLHDVGHHDDVLFVTMELLDGMTLSHHIAMQGRLSRDEAVAILRQLCAGLQAAHDAGVIHRDFKSGNVMLVRRGGELRAVITDFGLARTSTPDAFTSHPGHIIGTPAYMAPEQLQGRELTPAADIYALGVVAFEMVTGAVPLSGASLPAIDQRLEQVIRRCLEREPRDRFASALDVARALDDGVPRRINKWFLAIPMAVALIATAAVYFWPRERAATAQTATQNRRAVAVLGFRNLSPRGDVAWLSTALTEMLATELAAAESLRIVPGEEIARAKRDLAIQDVDTHAPKTLARLKSATGADFIVTGSYVALPDKNLRLDLRVQRTAGGDTAASFVTTGTESDLFTLVARAGGELRERLGADARLAEGLDLRRAVPLNTTAARHFAEGVARLRSFDAIAARESLERAIEADPQFALAYGELSDAYAFLGYDEKAAAAARKAVELSGRLPRSERLLLEALYHQRSHRLKEAIDLYRSLIAAFPDDPEHRVRLVTALVENSRGNEALKEIETMRGLRGPYDLEPRVDQLEAWAAETISDYQRMLAAADRALAKARAVQNRDVAGEALVSRAWALAGMSRMSEALVAFDEAEDLFNATGNRAGVAKSLRKRSFVFWRRGELDEAKRLNERALRVYREIGQQLGAANAMGGVAVILNSQGDHSGARELFTQCLEIYRRVGDRQNTAWAVSGIGGTHVMQGNFDEGIRFYEEALKLARDVGDMDQVPNTLANLGTTYMMRGDLRTAEARLREAQTYFRKNGDISSVSYCEAELGGVAYRRGDLKAARAHHAKSMEERRQIGERAGIADNQQWLALIELEERNATSALALATSAATEYETEKRHADRVEALTIVARANAVLGRTNDARAAIQAGRKLLEHVQDPETRMLLELEDARLRGDLREIERIAARAEKAKLPDTMFAARWAFVQVQMRSDRDPALARAAILAKDAEARGYGLIARRARSLR